VAGDTAAVPVTVTVLPLTAPARRWTLAWGDGVFDPWADRAAACAGAAGPVSASAVAGAAAMTVTLAISARTLPRRLFPMLFKPYSLSFSIADPATGRWLTHLTI
jgi:hypothetical protein